MGNVSGWHSFPLRYSSSGASVGHSELFDAQGWVSSNGGGLSDPTPAFAVGATMVWALAVFVLGVVDSPFAVSALGNNWNLWRLSPCLPTLLHRRAQHDDRASELVSQSTNEALVSRSGTARQTCWDLVRGFPFALGHIANTRTVPEASDLGTAMFAPHTSPQPVEDQGYRNGACSLLSAAQPVSPRL